MDVKLINAGGYGLFFLIAAAIVGVGLFLLFLGARSGLQARNNSDRVPTLAYVATVLGALLIAIPAYPVALLRSTTDLMVESEDEMVRFTNTMVGIAQRGFALYKDGLDETPEPPDPDATPTPLYVQDETPVHESPTAVPGNETAVPTVTGVWPTLGADATPTWTVLNPSEGPPTPTVDIVVLATQNAARVTAAPTLDPETWNPQTPVATPVR